MMSSKKGQGKSQKQCRLYGEYQWMMGEMGSQDAKGGKDKQKDQGKDKGKQQNCRCQGYYYECMQKGQRGKNKNKDKNKNKGK
ncbi:hypothetical protein [Rossellomorea sp. KS-H15a]|uniref:hypothetical protein n=1 Tax=Rossellomorea sp. KS-H15a TaxID=2963940 RepID=UPI0020C6A407|nr:hypothetical protein [Rossellomorea sp. KS-H15a]UTE77557.1 hypothetical protein M1J35_01685 [Rossellomorea sp. KS-H15a]